MRLSLAVGVVMLVGKVTAFWVTHSAAFFSDAAESVVTLVAVAFAAFSLRLSAKPAEAEFLYGYERISFFSAEFEGAMIVLAAIAIVVAAIHKWLWVFICNQLSTKGLIDSEGREIGDVTFEVHHIGCHDRPAPNQCNRTGLLQAEFTDAPSSLRSLAR